MFCIYLALILFAAGMGVWVIGSLIDKKKQNKPRAKRKEFQRRAEKLATIARILFVLCALFFILGFIMLQGAQM